MMMSGGPSPCCLRTRQNQGFGDAGTIVHAGRKGSVKSP